MVYALDNNMSYKEYHFLEHDNPLEWRWPFLEPTKLEEFPKISEDYKFWLAGFSEAESCFCIRKNGSQSFSISQKSDLLLIESIKSYFELPNKIQLQKKSETFVLETYNLRCCLKIINFFDTYNLRGEKGASFDKFKKHVFKKLR
jgi:hypothetical protein